MFHGVMKRGQAQRTVVHATKACMASLHAEVLEGNACAEAELIASLDRIGRSGPT